MSQDDKEINRNFLSRWSQRKQDAKLTGDDRPVVKPSDPTAGAAEGESGPEEKFDLSKLPKIEEVTEATDIKAFLRKGVPEDLRNAALRKSWALDSAVRNYVNPALDYAYDWNTPGGVPGHSELSAGTDIAKMVLQIMGSDPIPSGSPDSGTQAGEYKAKNDSAAIAARDVEQEPRREQVRLSVPEPVLPIPNAHQELTQHVGGGNPASEIAAHSIASQQKVRRHGTAKPRV